MQGQIDTQASRVLKCTADLLFSISLAYTCVRLGWEEGEKLILYTKHWITKQKAKGWHITASHAVRSDNSIHCDYLLQSHKTWECLACTLDSFVDQEATDPHKLCEIHACEETRESVKYISWDRYRKRERERERKERWLLVWDEKNNGPLIERRFHETVINDLLAWQHTHEISLFEWLDAHRATFEKINGNSQTVTSSATSWQVGTRQIGRLECFYRDLLQSFLCCDTQTSLRKRWSQTERKKKDTRLIVTHDEARMTIEMNVLTVRISFAWRSRNRCT